MPPHSDAMTVRQAIIWAESVLKSAGIDSSRADAEWIVGDILSVDRPTLYLTSDAILSQIQIDHLYTLIKNRSNRVPLQHILGHTEFFSLPFDCSPDALIPRPETEILVETAIFYLEKCPQPRILDLCTGSGVIAVSLCHSIPGARVTATDLSFPALRLAGQNARMNGVANRISFLQGDFLSPLKREPAFHAIVANPPYIPSPALPCLQPEVRDFDPWTALDGGQDGLTCIRTIISEAHTLLLEGGFVLLETEHNQCHTVAALLRKHLPDVKILKDLTRTERFVIGIRTL